MAVVVGEEKKHQQQWWWGDRQRWAQQQQWQACLRADPLPPGLRPHCPVSWGSQPINSGERGVRIGRTASFGTLRGRSSPLL